MSTMKKVVELQIDPWRDCGREEDRERGGAERVRERKRERGRDRERCFGRR